MTNNINNNSNASKSKVVLGAALLLVGGVLLLKQLNLFFIPDSLDLWPLWIVFAGVYIGAKNNWQKSSWLIVTGVGIAFFLDENLHNIGGIVWPAGIIALGIYIIMRKNNKQDLHANDADYWDKRYKTGTYGGEKPLADFGQTNYTSTGDVPPVNPTGSMPPPSIEDILDATAIFGGVNKTILSKNFRGGDITNIFGGTELDFTHADIQGRVVIDITQVFGGTKLIVPSNWHVVPDLSAIFAGVDDKRIKNQQALNNDKVLVLKGVSMFAGVDIRSY
jgi:predicted membrane protein